MKIVFMGTPQAAVPALERSISDGHEIAAVYTQPDRPSGRGNKITFSPVKQAALDRGLTVLQPQKVRTPDAIAEFRSHAADIAVVVAYGRILPDEMLYAFPKGAVNVHFSLLPKYRGAAPVNWAIVRGEEKTGVTTMKMDTGLDTGDILMMRETKIGDRENAVELMERLSEIGAELLSQTLGEIDFLTPVKQVHEDATLAPILSREDGRFDWSLSAIEIERRVRGFQPFPTAFTTVDGKKLTLWEAFEITGGTSAEAGTIVAAGPEGLLVACGEGSVLRIEEVQPEGKRRMSARDLVNGSRLTPGTKLV